MKNWAAPSAMTTNSLTTTMNWSSFLGLTQDTGPNGDSASINYDATARPQTTTSPYGATTSYTYNDTASPPTKVATTNGHWTKTTMDGFGRTIQVDTGYGSTTVNSVQTQYAACGCSPLGKVYRVSRPYQGSPSASTSYSYDGIGRTLTGQAADGASTTTYSYLGNTVTVTDPAGNWKIYTMDALGNVTQVVEPGSLTTTYTYDVLDHLTGVSMPRSTGTQTRTFSYVNTYGELTAFLQSATNPETGTVRYTYDSNNRMQTKTDAKGQVFTYTYDSYGRLTLIQLNGATYRSFAYDTGDPNFTQNALGRRSITATAT